MGPSIEVLWSRITERNILKWVEGGNSGWDQVEPCRHFVGINGLQS